MKTQPLYRYLSLAALLSIWGCSSTLQTAQNTGETDDLYGSSSNAQVYASASSNASSATQRNTRQRSSVRGRNANPDYNDEQQYGNGTNTDEYYSELSTRNLNRGISPDPGWTDNSANGYAGTNGYNSGFVNGYNAAQTSALSWNRWGFNNMGFYSGLGLGVGLGYGGLGGFGYSPFNSGFYSPYAYDSFAYGPFGYGSGFGGYGGFGYSPFYSPFGYSAFGYSPFGYGGGFGSYFGGGYYGGGYGYPGYVNNVIVTGADPYRNNRTYYSGSRTAGRYTSDFDNTNRGYNAGGRRAATGAYANSSGTAPAGSNSNSGYYAPRGGRNNSYYYDNGSAGRTSGNSIPTYSGNANATSTYSAPRGGRGYSNSNDYYSNGGGRSGAQQPSYQAPQRTYQSQQSRSYQQPSYQQQQPSYQSQSRSYSQPSFSAPSSGGFSGGSRGGGGSVGGGGGSVGGGGRGPR